MESVVSGRTNSQRLSRTLDSKVGFHSTYLFLKKSRYQRRPAVKLKMICILVWLVAKRMRSIIFFTLVVAISTFGGRGGVCKKCTTSVVYITTASLPLVHSQRQIDNNIVLINTTVLGSSASWYRTTANLPSNSFKTSSSILTTPTLFKKKDYIQWNECTCDFLCQRSASHHLTHSSYSALFMKHLLF